MAADAVKICVSESPGTANPEQTNDGSQTPTMAEKTIPQDGENGMPEKLFDSSVRRDGGNGNLIMLNFYASFVGIAANAIFKGVPLCAFVLLLVSCTTSAFKIILIFWELTFKADHQASAAQFGSFTLRLIPVLFTSIAMFLVPWDSRPR